MNEERGSGRFNPFEDIEEEPEIEQAERPAGPRALWGSLAGLVLLIIFHAAQTAHWIRGDSRPPAWDQSVQLETAWDLKEHLAAGDLSGAMRMRPKPGMPPFPLLYHATILPVIGSDDPIGGALWVNWAYLALLCFALWGLGRHFLGPWEGLGAAILFTCVPEVQWLQREVLVDIPLTAWVACAYWALAASEGFTKRTPSGLFGLLFAAAMMTKWSAFSYFIPALSPALGAVTGGTPQGLLLAAGAAALLAGPWYLAQAPILVPRLFEAAADQAVPLWQGAAVFSYPLQMASGLELPLLLLGVVSAFVPTAKRRTHEHWLLPAWFLASLIFWTIVPNRQLRYLLPGLVPLSILAMGPWPKAVPIAACALSVGMAWNYARGVLPNISLGPAVRLFARAEVPVKEDWRLGEILREAHELRERGPEFVNMAFVANHPRLNGPVLNWERKRLGLGGLRIRGVTKRYTELCNLVLVKTGELGPATVTGQLPEVQKVMLDPGRWFQRGWEEVEQWELPDKTRAVLFRRRKTTRPPAGEGRTRVDYFEEGNFLAEGMVLDLGRWDASLGVYPRASVSARRIVIRGLELEGVDLGLENLSFFSADETPGNKDPLADPRFTRLDAASLRRVTVTREALQAFLEVRVKGLESPAVRLEDGVATAEGRLRGVPVRLSVEPKLLSDGSGLELRVREAKLAGLPVPVSLFGLKRTVLPFKPSGELPFRISVKSLAIADGRLTIGG